MPLRQSISSILPRKINSWEGRTLTKFIEVLKKVPLLTAFIGFLFAVGGIKLLHTDGNFAMGVHRYLLALAMCVFLILISGEKTFKKCEKTTAYVLKMSIGIFIFAGLLCGLGVLSNISAELPIAKDWPLQTLLLLFAIMGVGMFEEIAFRAVISDAIIYQFRDKKWVFAVSAIVGSLLFGYVHVMSDDASTPLALAQVIMKTVSTGLWGMTLLFLYWKTRNIFACGIAHGIYDFILMVKDVPFVTEKDNSHSYVHEGFLGGVSVGIYVFESIVMIVILLIFWKKVVKTIDFEDMRKNW